MILLNSTIKRVISLRARLQTTQKGALALMIFKDFLSFFLKRKILSFVNFSLLRISTKSLQRRLYKMSFLFLLSCILASLKKNLQATLIQNKAFFLRAEFFLKFTANFLALKARIMPLLPCKLRNSKTFANTTYFKKHYFFKAIKNSSFADLKPKNSQDLSIKFKNSKFPRIKFKNSQKLDLNSSKFGVNK